MAMKGIHKAQTDMASHSGQPSGKKLFTETDNTDRTSGYGNSIEKNHPEKGGQGKLKEGNLTANASQPSGKSIGFTTGTQGSESKNSGAYSKGNGGGIFKTRGSVLRNSGVKGAHRLGCKK
jgi:hypothetical protein